MQNQLSKQQILEYLHRTDECRKATTMPELNRYFRHCLMAVSRLAACSGVLTEEERRIWQKCYSNTPAATEDEALQNEWRNALYELEKLCH
ncbi:MAG: hypothetical protein LBS74_01800 [Oscillospiraceae bacterium]|jgi:hypothetical protein|nr:hypothetical protein [Oscillospiraceae bacterium]